MAGGSRYEWLYAGGNGGGNDDGKEWDIKPIYRSLAAAYGWTYAEIDAHTLAEAKELFSGWDEHPPTNILVRDLLKGLGGGVATKAEEKQIPPEMMAQAMAEMQKSALAGIAAKAGPRVPILKGKDKGLPAKAPIFDVDLLREVNESRSKGLRIKDV